MAFCHSLGTPLAASLGRSLPRLDQQSYEAIEARLGHCFKSRDLLRQALTHASLKGSADDYQRLEFLGDRVLALVIAQELFQRDNIAREGDLARQLSSLVSGTSCAEVGRMLGLGDFILAGKKEHMRGVHLSDAILGDVMEALIAAIYLDGGFEASRNFILRAWNQALNAATKPVIDAKSFLQEWALGRGLALPVYEVTERTGPEHAPLFKVSVRVGNIPAIEGQGLSKRAAEREAAELFLKHEKIRL